MTTEQPASHALAFVILDEMSRWSPVSKSATLRRRELRTLAERILQHLIASHAVQMRPTHQMVSEIILDEMTGWHQPSTSAALRERELLRLCDRLIDYVDAFTAPCQLPGLPGNEYAAPR